MAKTTGPFRIRADMARVAQFPTRGARIGQGRRGLGAMAVVLTKEESRGVRERNRDGEERKM